VKVISPKFACRHFEKTGVNNTNKQATVAASPIHKIIATSSLFNTSFIN
jgi:hypothetical protein